MLMPLFISSAAAFVVGEIEIGGPYETEEDLFPDLWTVLEKTLLPMIGGPVISGWPFGNSRKDGLLPIGVEAELKVKSGNATISWEIPESVWER
jgi:muramoyltetrapeptide carboxypeptidase LdcA involved in peptidoglycan recycling